VPRLVMDPKERCLLELIEATPGPVMMFERGGLLVYMNGAGRRMLSVPRDGQLTGFSVADFYTPQSYRTLIEHAVPRCLDGGQWHGEATLVGRDGKEVPVSQLLLAHQSGQPREGAVTLFSSIAWDLRAQKRIESELRRQATHDPLTGLPNRLLLLDRLTQALHDAHRQGHQVAVLFVDLDDFKKFNDRFGHEAGDRLLRLFAARLRRSVRAVDTAARYGGDEFVVVVPDMRDAVAFARISRSIERKLNFGVIIDEVKTYVSASVGAAAFPDDGHDVDTLLQRADAMMFRQKSSRRPSCTFLRRPV
jgi:diguanylate cyclase (GGDEF)-like protein